MAKDDETGVDAKSKDGEGAPDNVRELPGKGKNGSGSMKSRAEAAAEEQARLDAEDGKGEPDAGIAEEDDGQTFLWERGRKVTLGTLIARGTPVEHAFVFGGRRTKGSGGLMGFDEKPLMIVRGKPGPVKIVPTYNDDEKIEKVTVESHVNAVIVQNADSDDGLDLIAHILDGRGWQRPAEAA